MKKNILKLLAILAMVALMPLSCKKPEPEPTPDPEPQPDPIETQAVTLTMPSGGGEVTLEVTTTGAWTLEKDENYKWITATPESGAEGTTTVTFAAGLNDSGRERSAMYYVMQGKETAYEVLVTQAKNVIPVGEGDLAFLKEIVDGKLFGDATPVINDWYAFQGSEFDGTGISLVNIDGMWYVCQINIDFENCPLLGWPKVTNLPAVEYIRLWDATYGATLKGVEISPEWNTPKLEYLCLSHTKMTGIVPAGLAASPLLNQIYCDDTDFYGALPHDWATKVLEVCLLGTANNCTFKGDDPYADDKECPYLGYMMPASLDVVLCTEIAAQNDVTQLKVGGVKEGHWLGFEEGWGQRRYELFDPAAETGNTQIWSLSRLMIPQPDNEWGWFVSNMGYTPVENYKTHIPFQMMVWDQAVADAFTAEAKICHDAKTPIDMTKFGKEPEEKHDDDIQAGNVVDVDDNVWQIN